MKHELLGFDRLLEIAAWKFRDDEEGWAAFVAALPERVAERLKGEWWWQAHGGQSPPDQDWAVWLLMAGRGFGKTRAGAEWVWGKVRALRGDRPSPNPLPRAGGGSGLRIALVGATREDAVRVMVEGPSGLLRLARPGEATRWVATRGELQLPGGALAFVYSAEAPEALRGPEHHFAWCDELGKWAPRHPRIRSGGSADRTAVSKADAAWDNLMMGLRLGDRPQAVVTTTPRTTPLLKRVMALPGAVVTGGRMGENVHLPQAFTAWMAETYGGTRLGRQELDGELIEEVEGSLFPLEVLERCRESPLTPLASGESPSPPRGEGFRRIVVGVDPPASAGGDACGIVVCGSLGGRAPVQDGHAPGMTAAFTLVVLADHSVAGMRPEGWARAVVRAAEAWGADRVVAEKNQGGEMVGAVLRTADCMLPVTLVHASRGKAARAEPIAALMEAGRVRLAGHFPELETELHGLRIDGGYDGRGSPDRADACVWALAALIEGARRGEPRAVAL